MTDFEIQLSDGSKEFVNVNDSDEWLDYVYTTGQCVAYAVALAESMKLKEIFVIMHGPALRHAYAYDEANNALHDIRGDHDLIIEKEIIEDDFGASYYTILKLEDVRWFLIEKQFTVESNFEAAKVIVASKTKNR